MSAHLQDEQLDVVVAGVALDALLVVARTLLRRRARDAHDGVTARQVHRVHLRRRAPDALVIEARRCV